MDNQNQTKKSFDKTQDKIKIWLNDKENIVQFEMGTNVVEVEEGLAKQIHDDAVSFLESRPEKKLNILIDLGKSKPSGSEVRKILAKTLKISKMGRIAFYSTSITQGVIVNFVAKASGRKDTKNFTDKEEALKWLKTK